MPGPGSRACPKPERVIDKVRRHISRRKTAGDEQKIMAKVRAEDRYCRFPLCGCGRMKLPTEIAHAGEAGHRGMGGNRSLSATTPENLILLCRPRHRAHKFSIDKKTLRVVPLTPAGLRGPVQWWVDWETLQDWALTEHGLFLAARPVGGWVILAEETAPHQIAPLEWPRVLELLAGMEC